MYDLLLFMFDESVLVAAAMDVDVEEFRSLLGVGALEALCALVTVCFSQ